MMSMLPPFASREPGGPRRARRGMVLLPSILTVGHMFCGYACIMYAMRGDLGTAAPLIGIAMVLDMLDGRIARLTGAESPFGLQLDSLADIVSFGVAPAVLMFQWGLSELHRVGWAAGFIYLSATAMRLARFNLQSASQPDKRYFVGLPSPVAAGIPASTVFLFQDRITDYRTALFALPVILVPAILMVSTMRFRSFKAINFGWRRSYWPLFIWALLIAFVLVDPQIALVVLAYGYVVSAFVGQIVTRVRARRMGLPPSAIES